MRKLVLFSLLTAALLISACGVVVTPAWDAAPTEVAAVPTEGDLIRVGNGEGVTAATQVPPTATATQVPPTATQVPPTATQAATEAPTTAPVEATTAPDQAAAPAGDDPVAVLAALYDPAEGEMLFNQQTATGYACSSCHLVNSEQMLIGPGLLNISTRGATRVAGEGAATYIHNSIISPSAFVVPGFPDMLMPQTFSQVFTEDQIYAIVAYVLTLNG
ncbi:MAG: c-type cytochrome [Anaerolineae bacterium]